MSEIASITEVKTILQISGSTYDDTITALKPSVESLILKETGLTIASASLEPGLKLVVADFINFRLQKPSNVSSQTIGSESYTFINSYPNYLYAALQPYMTAKGYYDADILENYNYPLSTAEEFLEDFLNE